MTSPNRVIVGLRDRSRAATFLLLAVLLSAIVPTAAQQAAPPAREVTFRQVAPDLYFLFDFNSSNAVVLTTDDGVLVIDTRQHPRDGQDLLERIRKVTDKPIKWVINSHFHGDHHFGNARLQSRRRDLRCTNRRRRASWRRFSPKRWRGAAISSKAAASIRARSSSSCRTSLSTTR